MLESLKKAVYNANMGLVHHRLVIFTWGNVSGIDRERGIVAIKPSGVDYAELSPEKMVLLDLDGKVVEGELRPSSDTPTHLELYRRFPQIGGITHTHSTHAVAFAQARLDIPCYGTTHADYFADAIPCTRDLTPDEVDGDYELATGRVIAETFETRGIDPIHTPAVLCANHGPFAWGKDAAQSVYHAAVLEEVAKIAILTRGLDTGARPAPEHMRRKHFLRKHGPGAYYGQN